MRKESLYCYYLALFACFSLVMTSCYNDNGNYDYSEIKEVGIGFATHLSDTLLVSAGDSLKLSPTITYGGEASSLTYQWKIFNNSLEKDPITNEYPSAVVISEQKDLKYQVTQGPGKYTLVLTVTDNTNHVSTYYSFYVSVDTLKGLVVLVRKIDGSNEIDVVRDSRVLLDGLAAEKQGVAYDIYSGSNDGNKLNGAKSIYRAVYRATASYVFDDDIYVFGDHLSLKLNTTNYSVTSKTMDDFFVIPPSSSDVRAQVMSKGQNTELIIIDGRIYCYGRYMISNTKFGIDINVSDNYQAAPFLPYFPVAGLQYASVFFDEKNHCFRPVDLFGSSILNLSDTITKPFNLRNIDMKLRYLENGNINYTYGVFLDYNDSNRPYLLVANFVVAANTSAYPKPIYKIDLSAFPGIREAVDYTFSTKGHVMFYATSSQLYAATYRDGKYKELFTSPADEQITKLKVFKDDYNLTYDGKLLIIATKNIKTSEGKIYIVQFNGANGTLDETSWKTYGGLGEVIQWAYNN